MRSIFISAIMALCVGKAAAQAAPAGARPATQSSVVVKEVNYIDGQMPCKGYIAYDPSVKTLRPAILVLPEWWGVNQYPRKRAEMLAQLGYIAMVIDLYGRGKVVTTPADAAEASANFYKDPYIAKSRVDAAVAKLKNFPGVDPKNIGMIGYCFGGAMALDIAKMGGNLKGVVSFHGGLAGVNATRGSVKGRILVCHGAADKFVSAADIKAFRTNLDTIGVSYTFKQYAGALHAFTNPAATETGKQFNLPIAYNEAADKASWDDMKKFFAEIFPARDRSGKATEASGK